MEFLRALRRGRTEDKDFTICPDVSLETAPTVVDVKISPLAWLVLVYIMHIPRSR